MMTTETKPTPKKDPLTDAVVKCSELLVKNPQAATLVLEKRDGKSAYTWVDNSLSAKRIRKQLSKELNALWQGGAYNYQQLADVLRLQVLDIQGLIDEQFKNAHGV